MSLDLLGVDEIGFDAADLGTIFQAAGEIAKGGIAMKEKSDAEAKTSADDQKALDAAIAADAGAAVAVARAAFSAKFKSDSASLDKTAADQATQTQDRAGARLSSAATEKRADAAGKALAGAIAKAQASPKDAFLQALVDAWQKTANKAHNGKITRDDGEEESRGSKGPKAGKGGKGGSDSGGGDSFLTRKVVGPVPGWGIVAGGAGVAALLAKRFLFK